MSARGRPRPALEPAGPALVGWALLVIAAALIGGLAAAALVHSSVTIAVIVSVVTGAIAVLVLFRSPARPDEQADPASGRYAAARHRQAPPAAAPPATAPPAAAPPAAGPPGGRGAATVPRAAVPPASFAPASDPVAGLPDSAGPPQAGPDGQARGPETVVQMLPLPQPGNAGAPPDAPWWDSAQAAPPAPSPGAKRAPAPDLSTYLASTFIAQCPRCGAFRLDIRRARNGWDFRCESCDYTWTWQPGTPWPPVRVMPRDRRE